MALRSEDMDTNFLTADPPPGYQPRTDLATEYFNTFNQICETYRPDGEGPRHSSELRSSSNALRVSSAILDGSPEFISTDFQLRQAEYELSERAKDEQLFSFGQPDAAGLLRARARRRYHEERGLPAATSHESGYGSDEFGHDSPSRYASPKGAGAGGAGAAGAAPYQEPYYGGEWAAPYYQPPPPYHHDPYATSPGAGGEASAAGGAELPLPPMSSFRAAAPVHSPTDPMLVAKPTMQPMYAGAANSAAGGEGASLSSYGSSPSTPVHSPPPLHARLYPPLKHSPHHPHHAHHNGQQANWVSSGVSSPPSASTPHAQLTNAVLPNGHHVGVFPPPVMGAPAEQRQLDEAMVFLREHSDVGGARMEERLDDAINRVAWGWHTCSPNPSRWSAIWCPIQRNAKSPPSQSRSRSPRPQDLTSTRETQINVRGDIAPPPTRMNWTPTPRPRARESVARPTTCERGYEYGTSTRRSRSWAACA
ncbi:unnamed protein product [Leptidea sinapis]|uniref:Uncharacterized protein n=1 Tax=Leptidea sinapis TaxID=189913 RepID=A0A5E4QK14_9NEOP|nr:unnamed protein product [Leptidea sinapis]